MRKLSRVVLDVPNGWLRRKCLPRAITYLSSSSSFWTTSSARLTRQFSSTGVRGSGERKLTPIEKANANRRAERFLNEQDIEKAKREHGEDNIWDDKTEENGMDLVFRRATNILQAVTERRMTKLLQIYCGGENVKFFDADGVKKANWIIANGISDDMTDVAECSTLDIFADCHHAKQPLDRNTVLPFKDRDYGFTVCMQPISTKDCSLVDIAELSRVTNHDGFIIIGARAKIWEGEGMMEHLENNKSAQLLSVQSIECKVPDGVENYFLALLRK